MARRPDNAVLLAQYIQVLPVLDHRKLFVWWDANNSAHLVRRDSREPLLVHRHTMLAKKLRDASKLFRRRPAPDGTHPFGINGVHIDRGPAFLAQFARKAD